MAVLEAFSKSFGNIPPKMQFCQVTALIKKRYALKMEVYALIRTEYALICT